MKEKYWPALHFRSQDFPSPQELEWRNATLEILFHYSILLISSHGLKKKVDQLGTIYVGKSTVVLMSYRENFTGFFS
jgi:hypothetical protein